MKEVAQSERLYFLVEQFVCAYVGGRHGEFRIYLKLKDDPEPYSIGPFSSREVALNAMTLLLDQVISKVRGSANEPEFVKIGRGDA